MRMLRRYGDVLRGCVTGRYWMCYDAVLQDVTGVL